MVEVDVASRMVTAERMLEKYFGYPHFRVGQRRIIEAVLSHRDTVGIMPTGGGKSICYQIPAMVLEGLGVVISPLVSLMKDQVDALTAIGVPATFINSSLSQEAYRNRIRLVEQGVYKLLYVSPERLENLPFAGWLSRLHPALVAIEEAHCLSHWGHDFRPSYQLIAPFLAQLQSRPIVVALTATATPEVVKDIAASLQLSNPAIYMSGFARDNLSFSVLSGWDKREYVVQYLRTHPNDAGIIYAATRNEVDELHGFLTHQGYSVGRYHAGMSDDERAKSQDAFIFEETQIMVATNAFGMGIDKSNVRFVIHHNMPKNVEAYYQEAGRAGRDGDPSECILLYSPEDVRIQKFLIEQSVSHEERQRVEIKKLYAMVDYCQTTQCLQSYVLRYFGDDTSIDCQRCSNCLQAFDNEDITTQAQQILSCVLRLRERYGMKTVAGVLRGLKDKKIMEAGLNRVSTYGLMKGLTDKTVMGYIRYLVTEGYLRVSDGQYPVLQLQRKAEPVLKQQEPVNMRVLQVKSVERADSGLFDWLRDLRRELALKDGVPPYVIFPDTTLREMATLCPTDRPSLLKIKGVGEVKAARYGQQFLLAIQTYLGKSEPN